MSLRRYAAKHDGNHRHIVAALRAMPHMSVQEITDPHAPGLPDLLVGYRGVNYLWEIKRPGEKPRPTQVEWARRWHGDPPLVAHCLDDILAALGLAPRVPHQKPGRPLPGPAPVPEAVE